MLIEYGLYMWVILLVANFLLLYAVHFYSHASSRVPAPKLLADVSNIPSISPSILDTPFPTDTPEPTDTPGPVGPVIGITFTMPGIGSGGGTLQPLHPVRNLTIYLYSPQLNSLDKSVKPLFIIKTQATFDTDPNSPTYTSYVNNAVDLGGDVPDDNYQVVIKTDQTLRTLVKAKPDDVGGQIFSLSRNIPVAIAPQTLIPGDIAPYPDGDNSIDINDYNTLVNCFGVTSVTQKCPNKQAADLDDNGVVDGVDYNLMILSFTTLLAQGYPVPTLTIAPTPAPTRIVPTRPPLPKKTPKSTTPVPIIQSAKKGSGGIGGVVFFFLCIIAIAAAVFFAMKKGLFKRFAHQVPQPASAPAPQPESDAQQTPAAETVNRQSDTIDKEYYVKKKSSDSSGIWLTLTDDNGQIDGLYKGDEVLEGFVRIKGEMKKEGDKTYILISQVLPVE